MDEDLARRVAILEKAILIALDELRAGDPGYAQRLLEMIERRILTNAETKGATVH